MNFYFQYNGNKRSEIKEFINFIDFNKFEIICEPFGGSLSFSRHCYKIHPNKTYLISDNNEELTYFCNNFYKNKNETFREIQEKIEYFKNKELLDTNACREEWKNFKTKKININDEDFLKNYYILNKCIYILPGIYPWNNPRFKTNNVVKTGLKQTDHVDEFFKNNKYEYKEFIEYLDEVKDNPKAFVFLDPPYPMDSCCVWYKYNDILKIWNYIMNFIKTCTCTYIMVVNSNIFMDLLFKEYEIHRYSKSYGFNSKTEKNENGKACKKKTEHIVVSNIKI